MHNNAEGIKAAVVFYLMCVLRAAPPRKLTSHHWSGEFFKPHPWRPSDDFFTYCGIHVTLYDPTLRLATRTHIPSLHGHYLGIIVINIVCREQIEKCVCTD